MSDGTNSNLTSKPSRAAYQDSTSESIDSKGGSLQYVKQIVEDKSQLILTILAMILAAFAIGQNISDNAARDRERQDMAQIIDAKIQAGVERARADLQQQAEQAKAIANAGATDGRLALDRVEKAVAKLEAKGLIKESH